MVTRQSLRLYQKGNIFCGVYRACFTHSLHSQVYSNSYFSFSDKEYLADNVKFEVKTVIDGHTASGMAGAAIMGIVVGVLLGLVTVSSLFQISIMGVQVPRIPGTGPVL